MAAEAFVRSGVKHVVAVESGMQVLDKAAQLFSRAFYLSLAMGDTVDAAFTIGREAVKSAPNLNGQKEFDKFVLLGGLKFFSFGVVGATLTHSPCKKNDHRGGQSQTRNRFSKEAKTRGAACDCCVSIASQMARVERQSWRK